MTIFGISSILSERAGLVRRPGLSDRPNMPYTQAVINETLRRRPIMPLALRHQTTCNTTLGKCVSIITLVCQHYHCSVSTLSL